MNLDLSLNKKLVNLKLTKITLASSPEVRKARTVQLDDVQMNIEHWRDFVDSLLSVHGKCEVMLDKVNDNNIVTDNLKRAGYWIDNTENFSVYPLKDKSQK